MDRAFSQNLKVPNQFYFQLFFTGGHCSNVRQRLREEPPDAEPNHDPRSHPGHGQERQQEEQLGAVVDGIGNDRQSDCKDSKEKDSVIDRQTDRQIYRLIDMLIVRQTE